MTKTNLTDYSLDDLKDLQAEVEKAIAGHANRRRQEALSELKAVAERYGYKLSDFLKPVKGKSIRPARYAHPSDGDLTWTGRGRRPSWLIELLESGVDLDSLAV